MYTPNIRDRVMMINYPTVNMIDIELFSVEKNPTLIVLKMIASPKNLRSSNI